MSSFLYVQYGAPATADQVGSDLHRFVIEQCAGKVLNNALQQYRYNVTTEPPAVLVEPFLSATSFVGLVGNKKKQHAALLFLEAMFHWAEQRGLPVCILIVKSRPRRPDEIKSFASLREFLDALP
jgi:hypothetical protein